MPKRVLAIGVGGTGKAVLTILKERLEETYGQVPENVVLLSFDTDDIRDSDSFAGTRLAAQVDERGRQPEFRQIVSRSGVTMNHVFADIASGRSASYMQWLEKDKLDRTLGPAERDIRGGAQQRRPVGRVAVFQRWDNPILTAITNALTQVYGEPEESQGISDAIKVEQSKRLVFIVGSVAGGTGSGFMIDIANLVRHAVTSNSKWQSVDVSAVIVLPDAFSSYAPVMNDPTNLKPNSYAALRELDRFIRTHSADLPYMIRYGDDPRSITWSTNQVLDHVYLIDTASPSAVGESDLKGDPMRGVFPVIADFLMSNVDNSLGDQLATLRSNAGQHYDKEEGTQYSSFNLITYILPMNDIIESFTYRFLRELFERQFLQTQDKKIAASIKQSAQKDVDMLFSQNRIGDRTNPGIIQKSIAATRLISPERPDVSWTGLFNMLALSDTVFADDYKNIQGSLELMRSNLIPSKDGEYKNESFDDGFNRLMSFSESFIDKNLGARYDPDNEDARANGQWDNLLDRYRTVLRQRFSEALDYAILDILNQRDPQTKVLLPATLVKARDFIQNLKERLLEFKNLLSAEYNRLGIDNRIRNTNEQLRQAIIWMQDTKDARLFILPFVKPDARKAQDAYIGFFSDRMELFLHQKIYRVVLDVIDSFGATERDKDGQLSVLDDVAIELDKWATSLLDVIHSVEQDFRLHEKNRGEKKQVKVREYLTDKDYEDKLYQDSSHFGEIARRVFGQLHGENGLGWKRVDPLQPMKYRIVTTWAEDAAGSEDIKLKFFQGIKNMFQVVRNNVTIADRLAIKFSNSAQFVNYAGLISEPLLRYNPSVNGKTMFPERYVSFNLGRSADQARILLEDSRNVLRNQGVNVDVAAEGLVACTVLQISRGVQLRAVEQFAACEPDYRFKLFKGRESLHIFNEEQNATDYEGRIEILNDSDNKMRSLSPELTLAMSDENKLKTFVQACAYGLIEPEQYWDGSLETTEIVLRLRNEEGVKKTIRLSYSQNVRKVDKRFDSVAISEQVARLYLNALQNFMLKAIEKTGIPRSITDTLVNTLLERGVDMSYIDNPFSLSMRDIGESLRQIIESLGKQDGLDHDEKQGEIKNASDRIKKLQAFLDERISQFKRSPAQRIKDMGTVMHLIIMQEINRLKEVTQG